MTEHAFYEAITHAQNRILYGNPVTDFGHVRANFVDAYSRMIAMKAFSRRAVDYFRSASLEDRRYLLFNPMTKAKVTMEGETVDAVAARRRSPPRATRRTPCSARSPSSSGACRGWRARCTSTSAWC